MGYLARWNYWTLFMLAGMAELAAIAVYLAYWFPDIPHWLTTLIFVIITAINLINVKAYGEVEFWALHQNRRHRQHDSIRFLPYFYHHGILPA